MPRIRSVHPDICVSETMAGLPAHLERTFVRLWTHCDDEGRCEDRPKIIKAAIYPEHDDVTAASLDVELKELDSSGLVLRYEVEGRGFLQVVSWDDYQHPQKPRPSKYPTPPLRLLEESRNRPGRVPYKHASGEGEGVGSGVGVGEESSSPPTEDDRLGSFEAFWSKYPKRNGKKIGKPQALTVWKRLKPDEVQAATKGVEHYRAACDSGVTLAKDAHRWLSRREFNDWQEPAQTNGVYRNSDEWTPEERGIA